MFTGVFSLDLLEYFLIAQSVCSLLPVHCSASGDRGLPLEVVAVDVGQGHLEWGGMGWDCGMVENEESFIEPDRMTQGHESRAVGGR